ncbi:MAG: response regulator transcription factor, partial [Actinomycetales bacterium]|nr:response regulator transcription factor [Actinomycetales bacterium]
MGWNNSVSDSLERRLKIGVLDDHALLVDSMASWIVENCPDMTVVLTATSWAQCLTSENFPPDLIFMDYQLAEPVSIEARLLTCRAAGTKVIVMSALAGKDIQQRVEDAEADYFFVKSQPMYVMATRARKLFGMPLLNNGAPLFSGLREALVLYVQGNSTREVADILNVQYETAKTFLRRSREKYARAG